MMSSPERGRSSVLDRVKGFLSSLYHPAQSFRGKIAHSSFWGFNIQLTNQVLMLVQTTVLARLLTPNDFGLYGIAAVVMNVLISITYPGFDAAMIQEKEMEKSWLDATWTIEALRGVLVALGLLILAPLAAAFFDAPKSMNLIRILAVAVLVGQLKNPAIVYFRKSLQYQKQYVYRLSGRGANFVVAIAGAYYLRSVWAMIYGLLAQHFAFFATSYLLHDYRPRPNFNREDLTRLFSYGKWLTGISIVDLLANKGDDIALGRLLGSTMLGFYRITFRISNIITVGVSRVVGRVFFPVYSQLQDQPEKLEEGFYRTLSVTTALIVPAGAGIALIIPDFVHLFLGEEWIRIVLPVRIMVLAGITRSTSKLWYPLYLAIGKPRFNFYKKVIRVIGIFGPLYPLAQTYGIEGVCVSVLIGQTLSLIWDLMVSTTDWVFNLKISSIALRILPAVGATLVMSAGVLYVLSLSAPGFTMFFAAILAGILLHLLGLALCHLMFGYSPFEDLAFFF